MPHARPHSTLLEQRRRPERHGRASSRPRSSMRASVLRDRSTIGEWSRGDRRGEILRFGRDGSPRDRSVAGGAGHERRERREDHLQQGLSVRQFRSARKRATSLGLEVAPVRRASDELARFDAPIIIVRDERDQARLRFGRPPRFGQVVLCCDLHLVARTGYDVRHRGGQAA